MGISVLDPLFYGDYDDFIKEMKRLAKLDKSKKKSSTEKPSS